MSGQTPLPPVKVSAEFAQAFASGEVAHLLTCSCGRTHFAGADATWTTDEERERLLRLSRQDPVNYLNTGDCASVVLNLGAQVVLGCPCGKDVELERWIRAHQEQIARYFKARAVGDFQEALRKSAIQEG